MVSSVFSATVKIYSPFMLVIVPTRGLFLSAIEAPMMLSPLCIGDNAAYRNFLGLLLHL